MSEQEPEGFPFDPAEHPDEDQVDELNVTDVEVPDDAEDPGDNPILTDKTDAPGGQG